MRMALRRKTTGLLSILYDTRFGTDSPATITANGGWFTFGLRGGCRRIWCNATAADDTGDGLSAATAKKTLVAAWAVFTNGSWTAGDQLMIAGTGGRTYTDDGQSVGWFNIASQPALGALAATYPTAVLCYDPADPTNAAKYGKLYGSDRPHYLYDINAIGVDRNLMLSNSTEGLDGLHGGFAVQGLIIDAQDIDGSGIGTQAKHDYVCYQNCQFKQGGNGNNNAASPHGLTLAINFSKCSFYGMWRTIGGNSSGLYHDDIDGLWVQDCIFVHCGWKVGSSRDDTTANGGTTVFGHSNYYSADCQNGRFDRNVYIDSASDGWGLRGDAAATQLWSFDEPIVGALTGYSNDPIAEKPGGSIVTVDDWGACGGGDLNILNPRGQGLGGRNAKAGTYARNGVLFDNPKNGTGAEVISLTCFFAAQIDQTAVIDKLRLHNYSNQLAILANVPVGATSKVSLTWSNILADSLAGTINDAGSLSSYTVSGTNVRTWVGGDYPNALTKAQLITALGFSTKADMVNAMLDFPHLPWAPAILGIVFPAYGATPLYQTALVPSLSGLPTPTVVYKTTLGNLTASNLNFTRGSGGIAVLSGCSANFALSSADLPAGFSLSPFSLASTGNIASGSNQITSVSGLSGVTPGMYVNGTGISSQAYVVSISGSTVTMSQNATATTTGLNLTFLAGGRTIYYDGSGSGAATPTTHILETNSDGAGTHTTALTLSIS